MPRKRTPADTASGKLILAVQKVADQYWHSLDKHDFADAVMQRAHALQMAIIQERLPQLLAGRTMRRYLDAGWVLGDPGVAVAVQRLEAALAV